MLLLCLLFLSIALHVLLVCFLLLTVFIHPAPIAASLFNKFSVSVCQCQPGVEFAIFRSQVRRPNHYTTEPPGDVCVRPKRHAVGGMSHAERMRVCTDAATRSGYIRQQRQQQQQRRRRRRLLGCGRDTDIQYDRC